MSPHNEQPITEHDVEGDVEEPLAWQNERDQVPALDDVKPPRTR